MSVNYLDMLLALAVVLVPLVLAGLIMELRARRNRRH